MCAALHGHEALLKLLRIVLLIVLFFLPLTLLSTVFLLFLFFSVSPFLIIFNQLGMRAPLHGLEALSELIFVSFL